MAKLKLAVFFAFIVMTGVVGLFFAYRQYFGTASFEVYAGFNGIKQLDGEVSFTLKRNMKYNMSITVINNGTAVLSNVTIELLVPEGFTAPKYVGIIGDVTSGAGAGYVFYDITTPPTLGTYQVEIKVSSNEISRTFKSQIILEEEGS